jgi:hypothetical protein
MTENVDANLNLIIAIQDFKKFEKIFVACKNVLQK